MSAGSHSSEAYASTLIPLFVLPVDKRSASLPLHGLQLRVQKAGQSERTHQQDAHLRGGSRGACHHSGEKKHT